MPRKCRTQKKIKKSGIRNVKKRKKGCDKVENFLQQVK